MRFVAPTAHAAVRALTLVSLGALGACSDSVAPEPLLGEDGTWEALGEGVIGSPSVFLEFEGDLVAGGSFRTAGDQPARNIARWDGALWHPFGTGLDGPVQSLAVHDGELVAAGAFGESRVARWDGEQWHPVGEGPPLSGLLELAVHDGSLFATGSAGVGLLRWDGGEWVPFQVPADGADHPAVRPVVVHQGDLIVGVGQDQLARWDGEAWSWMERPTPFFVLRSGGDHLFGRGSHFARWTGSEWQELPHPPPETAWTVHEGRLVVATGGLGSHSLVQWVGADWYPLDGQMDGRVNGLGSFGRSLVAGGEFTSIDGVSARGIAGLLPEWAR